MTFHVKPSVLATILDTPFTDSAVLPKISVLANVVPEINGMLPSLGGV